jgi:hypothetical protein
MTDHRRPPEPHLSREALRMLSLTADEKKSEREADYRIERLLGERSLRPGADPRVPQRLWM